MTLTQTLDATLAATLDGALATIPGAVAMATDARATFYEGCVGTRDLAGRVPLTADTMFGLASMTKALVSAQAMAAVDDGMLSLDAALSEVLPALAAPLMLEGFAEDGSPRLRPARGAITLRQVLSHSAGFGYDTWNAEIGRFLKHQGMGRTPANAEELAATPLLFDPGTGWNYGINTDVAGLAVEAVTGQRLDVALREGILGALGMGDTTVLMTGEQRQRLVSTRTRATGGGYGDAGFVMDRGIGYCLGGGALHGTGRDYLRFIRMILNGGMHEGQRLLSPAATAAMSRNQLAPGVRVRPMISANPAYSADAEFFPGMEKHWSTAFMITTAPAPTGRRAGSLAWAGICNTYCWIDPAAGIGGVFMSQLLPFADPAVLAAFAAFETAVYAGRG